MEEIAEKAPDQEYTFRLSAVLDGSRTPEKEYKWTAADLAQATVWAMDWCRVIYPPKRGYVDHLADLVSLPPDRPATKPEPQASTPSPPEKVWKFKIGAHHGCTRADFRVGITGTDRAVTQAKAEEYGRLLWPGDLGWTNHWSYQLIDNVAVDVVDPKREGVMEPVKENLIRPVPGAVPTTVTHPEKRTVLVVSCKTGDDCPWAWESAEEQLAYLKEVARQHSEELSKTGPVAVLAMPDGVTLTPVALPYEACVPGTSVLVGVQQDDRDAVIKKLRTALERAMVMCQSTDNGNHYTDIRKHCQASLDATL